MKQLGHAIICLLLFCSACKKKIQPEEKIQIRGWNILTDHTPTAKYTLKFAAEYQVNQLQLSHRICHDLKDVKHQWNRNIVNDLTQKAHDQGIPEVLVWDHALYELDYYPDRFKINDNSQINLDDQKFWHWFKNDYRSMLEKIPEVDGIVLTLQGPGASVESQYSEVLKTPEEKLAALVDSVASLVMDERGLNLYIRSSVYNRSEPSNLMSCFPLIKHRDIVVMAKETPYDFFVTHPVAPWVKDIPFPVVMEFDCAHEFSGQGIVASIFAEKHLERWKYYQDLPNVVGYSIRTDRYGRSSILKNHSELNLFAINEATINPDIQYEEVLEKYIAGKFDSAAVSHLKPLFKLAPDIILSSYYTLGLNTTSHSKLDFDCRTIYTQNVPGPWMETPEVYIGHGVNKSFHYWKDIVNHLAPAKYKLHDHKNEEELADVFNNSWLNPDEMMDSVYLQYILTEKEYGVNRANEAMEIIKRAKPYCSHPRNFNKLYHTFNRTLMSAKLRKACAQVYYAQRVWNRGAEFQTACLQDLILEGLDEMQHATEQIKNYRRAGAVAQYDWKKDTLYAMQLEWEVQKSKVLAQK